MFSLKKIFLVFIPLFMINSTLPMWRKAAMVQSRNLGSRSARTATLLNNSKKSTTRLIAQRATTPIHRRVFSSQRRPQNRTSWFDWTKWKRSAWAIGTGLFAASTTKLYVNQHIMKSEQKKIEKRKKEILIQLQNGYFNYPGLLEYIKNTDGNYHILIEVLAENFREFCLLWHEQLHKLYHKLYELDRDYLLDKLIPSFLANIECVSGDFFESVVRARPSSGEFFIEAICSNPDKMIHPKLLQTMINYETKYKYMLNGAALREIKKIHPVVLAEIINISPLTMGLFIEEAVNNITHINPFILQILALDKNDAAKALELLKKEEAQDISNFVKKLILADKLNLKETIECKTQTQQHLKDNYQSVIGNNPYSIYPRYIILSLEALITMSDKVNQKERELQEEYYTFVHGQRWGYQFAENLFTKLYEWKNKKEYPEFLFTHIKKLPENLDEKQIHEELLTNGRTTAESRQRLLFLNYAFFGNTTNAGSSTVNYVAANDNVGIVKIDLREMFEWNNLEDIYFKYKSELEELQKEHNNLNKLGNLLLVAIPKKIIDDCTFPAVSGGAKKKVLTEKGWIWNSKTYKSSEVLEAIKTGKIEDSDKQEFCLIMTNSKHGGLNPESGIKIFDFNTVAEDKWAAYKAKEDALFRRIAEDIQKSKSYFEYEMNYLGLKDHELFF